MEDSSQMTIVDDEMVVDKSVQPLGGTSSGQLLTPDNTPERPVRSSSHSSLLTIGGKDKIIQDLEQKLAGSQREVCHTLAIADPTASLISRDLARSHSERPQNYPLGAFDA